jgi:recombinational DNA repair protein (RecF pathway)
MLERCYICGNDNTNVHQEHHVIPKRYGGEEIQGNTVTLCANCHQAVESLYNDRFFEMLDVESVEPWNEASLQTTAIQEFVDEVLSMDNTSYVRSAKLRDVYQRYAEINGLPQISKGVFGRELLGLQDYEIYKSRKRISGERARVYSGIKIAESASKYVPEGQTG